MTQAALLLAVAQLSVLSSKRLRLAQTHECLTRHLECISIFCGVASCYVSLVKAPACLAMPVFLEDPSHFSKERLKSELIAHNVALPSTDSKKKEYLELYLRNVSTKNAADFSSDEEEEQPVQVPSVSPCY